MAMDTVLKCRACGAPIDYTLARGGVVKCEYCCEYNTVPKKETEPEALALIRSAAASLYSCDFDRAYDSYSRAAQIDASEPEAYFGMALAEYKVQYIKDELAGRYQPICHELQDRTFSENKNYFRALELSTPEQKEQYQFKAREIDEVRLAFLTLKNSGLSYDCFICTKVTGDGGKKTDDSARANDIYYYLRDRGFKPFYSEREVQSRTGADYEALILYALRESKCMIVVCSDESYLNTPWVKNEYTRFIRMINDEEKAAGSVTIVFSGAPIEKLPGKKGKIQGVNASNMDAMSKLEEFVRSHVNKERKAALKYCIECGAALDMNVKYCPDCGKSEFAASEEDARLVRAERAERSRAELKRLKEEAEKAKAEKEKAEQEKAKAEQEKENVKGGFFAKLKSAAQDLVKEVASAADEMGTAIDDAIDGRNARPEESKSEPEKQEKVKSEESASENLVAPNFKYSDGGKVTVASADDDRVAGSIEYAAGGGYRILVSYEGAGGDVVIPKGICAIADFAFRDCKGLKSVVIPEGVTVIGANAFSGCSSLKSVTFPKGLIRIGEYAFCDCKNLEAASLPSSVIRVEGKAFAGCHKMKKLVLSGKLGYLGDYAFYGCASIVGVGFPHNSMSIGKCAFSGCSALKSAVITREVHSVGENAFLGCELITAYCEAPKCPKDWDKDWNVVKKSGVSKSRCKVMWNYKV